MHLLDKKERKWAAKLTDANVKECVAARLDIKALSHSKIADEGEH